MTFFGAARRLFRCIVGATPTGVTSRLGSLVSAELEDRLLSMEVEATDIFLTLPALGLADCCDDAVTDSFSP